jgi:hypothetical protein
LSSKPHFGWTLCGSGFTNMESANRWVRVTPVVYLSSSYNVGDSGVRKGFKIMHVH